MGSCSFSHWSASAAASSSPRPEPYIGGAILILVFYRHLIWIEQTNLLDTVSFAGLAAVADNAWTWLGLLALLVIGHAGLVVLVLLARGFTLSPCGPAAEVERAPVDPDARTFVYCLALLPAAAIGLAALFTGRVENFLVPALPVLTALAVIVLAPDRIRIVHQSLTQHTWAMLLLLPPLIVAIAIALLPWTFAVDLRVAQPAAEMGRFFAQSFERRTGRPLAGHRRHVHGGSCCTDRAEPAKPRILCHARAVAVGHAAGHRSQGSGRRLAGDHHARAAAAGDPAAFPGIGRRSAARVRAPLPGTLAIDADRLGRDPAEHVVCTCAVDQC